MSNQGIIHKGIYIGLGANLPSKYGSPEETLKAAKEALSEVGIIVTAVSKTYCTAPVPISDDPWYHNEVIQVNTDLEPSELLQLLHKIEKDFGRVRTVVNAPRLLDLDLLAYDDYILDEVDIVVPHPRMHERAFVLYPLRDINPEWTHPKTNVRIDALIDLLPDDQEIKVLHE